MGPTYKLIYWPMSGVAEPIRYLLSYGGIEFEDFRIEKENWLHIRPHMPFGQVPVLEIDGKQTYQSVAICRYLAREVKLCGLNDWEDMEIDAIVDTINDLRKKMSMYYYHTGPDFKERLKGPLFDKTIPHYLKCFEEIAKENRGHLAAGKLTWADFYFVGVLEHMDFMFGKRLIEGYINLEKVEYNVLNLPSIKDWNRKRPVSEVLVFL
ncbi:hypothetical protein FQA39_LY05489 [Lamprigera yunnana]|nr:hypothetical protein FQA39_LY05489 [Lamprigera yunnana]